MQDFTEVPLLTSYYIGSPLEPWIIQDVAVRSVLHQTFLTPSRLYCRRWMTYRY